MYHQNLGGRRFTNLTWEMLYETPRSLSNTYQTPTSPYKSQGPRPPYAKRAASASSTSSASSSPSRRNSKRRSTYAQTPSAASKIAAAAAFAEEREQRGRRKQRVSTATTVNGDGVVHEVGVDDLKEAAMMREGAEDDETRGRRKSSATLSIVLNEFEKDMNKKSNSRSGTAEEGVEEYTENVESRIPNIPYKSVTHPDVAQPRSDEPAVDASNRALTKPSWRKQPLEKISQKTHNMKTSFREKVPFLRNGSTMDRIRETFKFSRFAKRN